MWLNEQLTSKMLEPFSISAMANLEGSHFSFLPMTKSWNYHSTINCLAEKWEPLVLLAMGQTLATSLQRTAIHNLLTLSWVSLDNL